MVHTDGFQRFQIVPQGFNPRTETEMDRLRRRICVFAQIQIKRLHDRFFKTAQSPNSFAIIRHDPLLDGQVPWIRHPAVTVCGKPVRILLAASGDQNRQLSGKRLWQHVHSSANGALRAGKLRLKSSHLANVVKTAAKSRPAILKGHVERRILFRSISGSNTQQQPAAGQDIRTCRRLRHMRRMAKRQDNAGNAERDAPGSGRKIAQVDKRIEHLSRICEAWYVEWNITQPDR